MRSDETSYLKWHAQWVHEQGCANHAVRDQLCWHGEEVKASLLSALVLHRRVAEGEDKPL